MKTYRLYAVFLVMLCSCFVLFTLSHRASAGMADKRGTQAGHMRESEVVTSLTTEPDTVTAGVPATIRFSLADKEGRPLRGLTVMHERYMHVVIVGQDFSVFAHIHPRDFERLTPKVLEGGRFFVRFTFPKAGRYVVALDFAVRGRPFARHFTVVVAGEPKMSAPREDLSRQEKAGGLEVSFATAPARLTAKKKAVLSYVFRKDGKPVTDLEPWLGAPMHLAIISSNLKYFMHVHGELPGMSAHGHHEDHMRVTIPSKFGPEIEVPVVFPAKGLYEVFGQAGYEGKVILMKFMVKVE